MRERKKYRKGLTSQEHSITLMLLGLVKTSLSASADIKYGINKASLLCVAAAAVTFSTNAAAQISLSHISLFSSLSVCQKCHFGFICGWVLLWMNTIYVPEQSKKWYMHQHSHCEWPCKRLKQEPILIDAYFCASENAFCIAVSRYGTGANGESGGDFRMH